MIRFSRRFFCIAFIVGIGYLPACNSGNNELQLNTYGGNRIDLFKGNEKQKVFLKEVLLQKDTAVKYSALVIAASGIILTDSSYNRTTGDNFYLYSAMADSTIKGSPVKKTGKLYFTAYKKLMADGHAQYVVYLVPFRNHTIIKNSLHVQWQWLPGAPLTELQPSH